LRRNKDLPNNSCTDAVRPEDGATATPLRSAPIPQRGRCGFENARARRIGFTALLAAWLRSVLKFAPLLVLIVGAVVGTPQLTAAELHVRGLGWFGNRTAEQRLKLLLGEQHGEFLDANAIEDAALVLISSVNQSGYLEPTLIARVTWGDGSTQEFPLDATLEHSLPRPLNVSSATLLLDKGRRFSLQDVTFTGLLAVTDKDARGFFIGEGLLIPLASERIYSPSRLSRAQSNLEEALRQQGYAEAVVSSGNVQIDRETGKVRAEINVKEGRKWIVTALNFSIADKSETPAKITETRLGQQWTSLWRQNAATAIRRWYYARGHPDVQVKLTPQAVDAADGTKSVTVVAEVIPGPVVHVGEVRFTGNTHTREKTLRRLVPGKTGDLLNPIRFDNGQARISQLGVFRSVDLKYVPADAEVRDVDYSMVEGRRQELSLLAGYGSYEQLRGGIEWRHYNLFDRAHTDSLKLIQSMKSSQGDYVYTVPELFGTTTDGSVRLFGLNREELSFRREEYGANISVLWPLRRLGVALTTGYTFKHLRNVDNELATRATDSNQADIASVDIGIVRDRRDNPLRPTKGYKLSAQVESANRALGGEVVYQQVMLGASYHTSWGTGRWIHAGVSHGLVTTFGATDDSTLPVSVRFYPGGDGSIRGYQNGEAAPRAANGEFVGAKSYLLFNLELEQALTSKWSVVAFGDALGTAARMSDYPFSEKLYSIGLGVRYQTIIGPVRVEYGHNLNPRPFDPAGTLQLSIGFPF
jgi:outer membrane protein insertion porin family